MFMENYSKYLFRSMVKCSNHFICIRRLSSCTITYNAYRQAELNLFFDLSKNQILASKQSRHILLGGGGEQYQYRNDGNICADNLNSYTVKS